MNMNLENINYCWSELIVEELMRCGVETFCIAPGSRNTPLALGVAKICPRYMVHFDERGLGFFALGTVAASGKPAVLISTSGSAVANFLPAVAECSKKKLPLIILSADRPYEAKDSGAPQTMKQEGIFGSYTSWETNLPAPTVEISPEVVLTTIDYSVYRSRRPIGSPVQINCMFREPLDPSGSEALLEDYVYKLKSWFKSKKPYTSYRFPQLKTDISDTLVKAASESQRGVIGVGKLRSDIERDAVLKLGEKLDWPIFADITSGLKFSSSPNIIRNYDQILLSRKFQDSYPLDFVIQIGGRMTGKRWYQYVEESNPKNYLMVLGHYLRNDPLHKVTHRIESSVADFTKVFAKPLKRFGEGSFRKILNPIDEELNREIELFSSSKGLNDISVARIVSSNIGKEDVLYLSSSMPVRDMDMYGENHKGLVDIHSNRGLNGIDGVIASAAGFAWTSQKRTVLIIGDLAALHDLNSLALVKGKDLTIVINNNGGGGIFSFLKAFESGGKDFEKLCAAPHQLEFSKGAEMFGINYRKVLSIEEFKDALKGSLSQPGAFIIETSSDRVDNLKFHKDISGMCRDITDNFLDKPLGGKS